MRSLDTGLTIIQQLAVTAEQQFPNSLKYATRVRTFWRDLTIWGELQKMEWPRMSWLSAYVPLGDYRQQQKMISKKEWKRICLLAIMATDRKFWSPVRANFSCEDDNWLNVLAVMCLQYPGSSSSWYTHTGLFQAITDAIHPHKMLTFLYVCYCN